MTQPDPVVAEIRESRDQRARQFGYDIHAIVKDARERDAADNREVVRLPARRPETLPNSLPIASGK
jgi:hypothetical protein